MSALSIIIAFLLLWMALAMGAIMVLLSLRRLWTSWATSPGSGSSGHHSGRKRWVLPLSALLLMLGLFFLFWGIFGTYRLIWVA